MPTGIAFGCAGAKSKGFYHAGAAGQARGSSVPTLCTWCVLLAKLRWRLACSSKVCGARIAHPAHRSLSLALPSFAGLPSRRRATARRSVDAHAAKGPVVVIDNYDSFTYNLCQVRARATAATAAAGGERSASLAQSSVILATLSHFAITRRSPRRAKHLTTKRTTQTTTKQQNQNKVPGRPRRRLCRVQERREELRRDPRDEPRRRARVARARCARRVSGVCVVCVWCVWVGACWRLG